MIFLRGEKIVSGRERKWERNSEGNREERKRREEDRVVKEENEWWIQVHQSC